jgi:starch-binding outer membrane protein SusE/F
MILMKKIANISLLLGLITFFSCEKDETRAYLDSTPGTPNITSPSTGTSKVLTNADSAVVVSFTWSAADFGFPSEVIYALQMDKAGNNFTEPIGIASVTSATTAGLITYEFNNKLLSMGLNYDEESTVEIRLRSVLSGINSSSFADTIYSEVITMNVTPYEVIVNYPKLYVAGSYQGWDPVTAHVISSVKSNDRYEGYIYFPDATTEFKLLKVAAWEEANTIGDPDASGTSGTLQIGSWGGNNIKVSGGPGYFKINADLSAKTYSYLNTDWGLIGSATPDGWNSDQNLTYDNATEEWTITLDLTVGDIKFRANNDWALNYGDDGADGKLDPGGANIAIAEAGNYTIRLILSKPVYAYKVVKN